MCEPLLSSFLLRTNALMILSVHRKRNHDIATVEVSSDDDAPPPSKQGRTQTHVHIAPSPIPVQPSASKRIKVARSDPNAALESEFSNVPPIRWPQTPTDFGSAISFSGVQQSRTSKKRRHSDVDVHSEDTDLESTQTIELDDDAFGSKLTQTANSDQSNGLHIKVDSFDLSQAPAADRLNSSPLGDSLSINSVLRNMHFESRQRSIVAVSSTSARVVLSKLPPPPPRRAGSGFFDQPKPSWQLDQ